MYQPGGIASFQVGDQAYYLTANEGAARIRPTANSSFGTEGSLFNEQLRISTLALDLASFPNANTLKNINLGCLTATNNMGDGDGARLHHPA